MIRLLRVQIDALDAANWAHTEGGDGGLRTPDQTSSRSRRGERIVPPSGPQTRTRVWFLCSLDEVIPGKVWKPSAATWPGLPGDMEFQSTTLAGIVLSPSYPIADCTKDDLQVGAAVRSGIRATGMARDKS